MIIWNTQNIASFMGQLEIITAQSAAETQTNYIARLSITNNQCRYPRFLTNFQLQQPRSLMPTFKNSAMYFLSNQLTLYVLFVVIHYFHLCFITIKSLTFLKKRKEKIVWYNIIQIYCYKKFYYHAIWWHYL